MNRKAIAIALMRATPVTDRREIEVIYYGEQPTYVRVTTQVAGSHTQTWGAIHQGSADAVAQQMLETPQYSGYTLKKTVR